MNDDGSINSPAQGNWTLNIINKKTNHTAPISFLPTGDVDTTKTPLANLTAFLGQSFPQGNLNGFWKMLNWIVVSLYWTTLYDVGQISPTFYSPTPEDISSYQFFYHAQRLPSTFNIFEDEDLFSTYSTFLRKNVLTLPPLNYTLPDFQPINATNRLQESSITFLRSYSCELRKTKEAIDLAVGFITAFWVFLHAGWTGAGFIVPLLFKYKERLPGFIYLHRQLK
jgi:hypothetical protein